MRNIVSIKSVAGLISLGAVLLVANPVFALGVGGWEGKSAGSGTASCFQFNQGGVQNTCGQTNFILPLRSNSGLKTVALATNNPGGGTFQCTLFAQTQFGPALVTGTSVFPGVGNVVSTLQVTVPNNGIMYILCNMNTNSTIWSANYNE